MYLACFATVNFDFRIRHRSLKHQFDLFPIPSSRQIKLVLIHPFFIGNPFRKCLAIKAHPILVSTETLQLPARRHTYLRPSTGIITSGTIEIPFYHIITPFSRQIPAFRIH